VGEGGLEPPRGCPHRNLNPARLPIPPLARSSHPIVDTSHLLYSLSYQGEKKAGFIDSWL
jgi:hypothetical protein